MGFFKEFKEFAMKGNVMDMAVGVIIGGAFGKIVSSLVNDILMPPIGALLGNVNFTDLRLDISKIRDMSQAVGEVVNEVTPDGVNIAGKAAETLEPVYWNYGAVHRLYDSGSLRFPDGQADEPSDEEKGGGAPACTGTRSDERGAVARRDPRPVEGEEVTGSAR